MKSAHRIPLQTLAIPTLFIATTSAILPPPSPAIAMQATSGNSLTLDNGQTCNLASIHAPLPDTPQLAAQAKDQLNQLLQTQNTILSIPPKAPRDRYGRIAAQAYLTNPSSPTAPPIWLQGELLREGLAFIYSFEEESHLDKMTALETEARRTRRGIWNDPFYAGKSAKELTAQDEGRYAFVRGKVVDAIRIKNKVYLNFGPDWRSDFTIMIAARNLKTFRKANLDPLDLKGQTILVRGWIKRNFGPMIEVTHPAQLTTLKDQE